MEKETHIQSNAHTSKISMFVEKHDISSYADILAVITAILSLLTFINLFRTKKLIKRGLITKSVVSDATYAISKINEIIKAQRNSRWENALDLYGEVANLLGAVKASGLKFKPNEDALLQASITHFRQNERLIEKNLSKGNVCDHVQLNSNVAEQLDKLNALLLAVKNEV